MANSVFLCICFKHLYFQSEVAGIQDEEVVPKIVKKNAPCNPNYET